MRGRKRIAKVCKICGEKLDTYKLYTFPCAKCTKQVCNVCDIEYPITEFKKQKTRYKKTCNTCNGKYFKCKGCNEKLDKSNRKVKSLYCTACFKDRYRSNVCIKCGKFYTRVDESNLCKPCNVAES